METKNNKISRAKAIIRAEGLDGLVSRIISKANPFRKTPVARVARVKIQDVCRLLLQGKKGLEIGGPSQIFEDDSFLPVYSFVDQLDGCNFSNSTVWEGNLKEGTSNFKYNQNKGTGFQHICDATDLANVPSGSYDFILSSHSLEHIANPFKAIVEWLRVLKIDGTLLLIVPHKANIFDHKRPFTKFDHLLKDYNDNIGEDDLTHLPEILELHDLSMDAPAGNHESFEKRSLKNIENRCLHHHVFDPNLVIDIFTYFNIQVEAFDLIGIHIIAIGRKKTGKVSNSSYRQSEVSN